jgi:hypothetical protein
LSLEDKVRIHKEIFHLIYNSNGGFTHDEVYTMPIYLRYFYLRRLKEQRETENKQMKDAEHVPSGVVSKTPSRPFAKKPF